MTDWWKPLQAAVVHLRLPPKYCSPNTHTHWRRKAEAVASYKLEATLAFRNAIIEQHITVPLAHKYNLTILFMVCGRNQPERLYESYRPLDADNAQASLKAALDGMAASGLVKSDSHLHLNQITFTLDRHDSHRSVKTVNACPGDGVRIAVQEIPD